jgi:hypothetical protein
MEQTVPNANSAREVSFFEHPKNKNIKAIITQRMGNLNFGISIYKTGIKKKQE